MECRPTTSVGSKVMDVRVEPRMSGMLPKAGLACEGLHSWLLDTRLTWSMGIVNTSCCFDREAVDSRPCTVKLGCQWHFPVSKRIQGRGL